MRHNEEEVSSLIRPRRLSLAIAATLLIPLALALAWRTPRRILASTAITADLAVEPDGKIERLDPGVDSLLPADAQLERVASGFTWTEGPLWMPSGDLLFAEITSNSIRSWRPGSEARIVLQPSGYLGSAPFSGPEPGSNGMTLDPQGRLTVAGHGQRDLWRVEGNSANAPHTLLAERYLGKRLNSPNDLVYRSDGSLYFTDPPYGLRTQKDDDPEKELQINGVYRIPHATSQPAGSAPDSRQLQLLIKDLPRPNGLAFSPDEKYLYVDNSEPHMVWMRYTVTAAGNLTHGQVFYDAGTYAHHGAPDGMKVDEQGHLYSAGPGGVWMFSPAGKHLGTILVPEPVGNVAWGGDDYKTLYLAASTSLYRISLNVRGVAPRTRPKLRSEDSSAPANPQR